MALVYITIITLKCLFSKKCKLFWAQAPRH